MKIADYEAIKQYTPSRPRDGSVQVSAEALIRISSQDLPDVSSPTAGDGSSRPGLFRSCIPAAESEWTIRASTHPRDRFQRFSPEVRPKEIGDEGEDACSLEEDADGDNQIPDLPATYRL